MVTAPPPLLQVSRRPGCRGLASPASGPTGLLSPGIAGARLFFCGAKCVSQQPREPERERPGLGATALASFSLSRNAVAPRDRGDGCQRGPGGESGQDAPSPRRRGAPLRPRVPLAPKAAIWLEQPQVCRRPAGRGPGTRAGVGARLCFFSTSTLIPSF